MFYYVRRKRENERWNGFNHKSWRECRRRRKIREDLPRDRYSNRITCHVEWKFTYILRCLTFVVQQKERCVSVLQLAQLTKRQNTGSPRNHCLNCLNFYVRSDVHIHLVMRNIKIPLRIKIQPTTAHGGNQVNPKERTQFPWSNGTVFDPRTNSLTQFRQTAVNRVKMKSLHLK